jgi:hypothetical protein
MEENNCSFDIVAELCKLVEKCSTEHRNNLHYSLSNAGACITIISETAPPTYSLQVLSHWDHITSVRYSTFVSAIHSSLIRGAREGVCIGLSGSLLRIQRAREEGRRPIVENDMMSWKMDTEQSVHCEEESGGVIWSSLLDGSAVFAKWIRFDLGSQENAPSSIWYNARLWDSTVVWAIGRLTLCC